MNLQDMAQNPFMLAKRDGSRVPFKGRLSKGTTIFTFQAELPVEDNDCVERVLPSGLTERYTVIDPGFHSAFHSIGDHFQMKVQKENAPTV